MSGNVQLKAVLAALAEDTSPNPATVFLPAYKASEEQPIKVKLQTILEAVVAGSANWGNIGGTLAAQTDLQNALDAKAPLANPAFTGVPTAPTAAPGTNSQQIATTAYVIAVRDALLNAAPGVLDTLDELAAALGDDANFAATVTTALAGKVPTGRTISTGSGLTGGGDLSANRTINLNFGGLADDSGTTNTDFLVWFDVSENTAKRIPIADFIDNFGLASGGGIDDISNDGTKVTIARKTEISGTGINDVVATINGVSGQMGNLQEWKVNGATKVFITKDGEVSTSIVQNIAPNALTLYSSAGVQISSFNGALTLLHNGAPKIEINGTGIGVFGATPVAKPTVTGSKGGNAALASLLTALAALGWVIDSSS